eukprot:595345-Pelagomonas_calceolata.AAC.1
MQGENVIHGVSCRLEAAIQANSHGSASNVFGLLHTFADKHAAKQKANIVCLRADKQVSGLGMLPCMVPEVDNSPPQNRCFKHAPSICGP